MYIQKEKLYGFENVYIKINLYFYIFAYKFSVLFGGQREAESDKNEPSPDSLSIRLNQLG